MTHSWLDEDLGCNDTPDFDVDDAVGDVMMRFKEVWYSALRLAWKFQKIRIDQAKTKHNVKWFSLWNVAFAVALPVGAVVMSIREKQFIEDNHDVIVNCIERYWESMEDGE